MEYSDFSIFPNFTSTVLELLRASGLGYIFKTLFKEFYIFMSGKHGTTWNHFCQIRVLFSKRTSKGGEAGHILDSLRKDVIAGKVALHQYMSSSHQSWDLGSALLF